MLNDERLKQTIELKVSPNEDEVEVAEGSALNNTDGDSALQATAINSAAIINSDSTSSLIQTGNNDGGQIARLPANPLMTVLYFLPTIFLSIAGWSTVVQVQGYGSHLLEAYLLKCCANWLIMFDPVYLEPTGIRLLLLSAVCVVIFHAGRNSELHKGMRAMWMLLLVASAFLCFPVPYLIYFCQWIYAPRVNSHGPIPGHDHNEADKIQALQSNAPPRSN